MHTKVAIVSDTHGKVDAKLKKLFRNASVLIHAGDVNDEATLSAVGKLCPGATIVAVRGNNDQAPLAARLPESAAVDVQGVRLLAAHQSAAAEKALEDPQNARARVVVIGHSHKPAADIRGARLWVNPGGAGPKRFALTRAAAVLEIRRVELVVKIYSLEDDALPVIHEARITAEP